MAKRGGPGTGGVGVRFFLLPLLRRKGEGKGIMNKQPPGRMAGQIFLTGGTGSLGEALLERAAKERWDWRFTIYSRDEVKQGELRGQYSEHRFVLGDIRDFEALKLR